jgi:transposase
MGMTTTSEQTRTPRPAATVIQLRSPTSSICASCPTPLHSVTDRTSAYQFANAADAVAFARENGARQAVARVRAELTAGR